MNEDLIVEEVPLNNNEEIILNLNNVNSSINEITEFLKEQKRIEEKKEEDLKEQEKLDAPQLKKEAEEKQQKELEFIQTIPISKPFEIMLTCISVLTSFKDC